MLLDVEHKHPRSYHQQKYDGGELLEFISLKNSVGYLLKCTGCY